MTRTRSFSIVKPPQPKEDEEAEGMATVAEEAEGKEEEEGGGKAADEDRQYGEEGTEGEVAGSGKPQVVRYTDIRQVWGYFFLVIATQITV